MQDKNFLIFVAEYMYCRKSQIPIFVSHGKHQRNTFQPDRCCHSLCCACFDHNRHTWSSHSNPVGLHRQGQGMEKEEEDISTAASGRATRKKRKAQGTVPDNPGNNHSNNLVGNIFVLQKDQQLWLLWSSIRILSWQAGQNVIRHAMVSTILPFYYSTFLLFYGSSYK